MREYDASINLLDELDNLSKIHSLERVDIDALMLEFAQRIIIPLRIERTSVWLFSPDRSALISMGEYDSRSISFKKNNQLLKVNYPNYFKALEKNKILLAENIHTHSDTKELSESYALPNEVISLMDIPLRICGELIGVMCFEKTGKIEKKFNKEAQTFAFSVSLVFASTLEARHRRAAQHKLTAVLEEKELLIKEINHRVKNNFGILISLLRLSRENGLTTNPKILLEEYEQRIFSMLKIHDLLNESGNYTNINIAAYLGELINEFRKSHPELSANIHAEIEKIDLTIHSKSALHIGLIVTEIFLNSVKHSIKKLADYSFSLHFFKLEKNSFLLQIKDNGPGFDFTQKLDKNTLGLPLIKDLAKGLNFTSKFPTEQSSTYSFTFSS